MFFKPEEHKARVKHNSMYNTLTCLMATESASTVKGVPLALITSRMASVSDKTKFSFLTPSVCSACSSQFKRKTTKFLRIGFLVKLLAWPCVRAFTFSCPIENEHEFFDN